MKNSMNKKILHQAILSLSLIITIVSILSGKISFLLSRKNSYVIFIALLYCKFILQQQQFHAKVKNHLQHKY